MTEKLEHSIENLYKIFSKYPASDMTGSDLYEDLPKWNKDILSKPLRKLDEDDLSRFTAKAMTTWGNANDYKHFLPRIFELTAELKSPYNIWIIFDKLNLAEWQHWTEEEQNAIYEFMIALWENMVNDNSPMAEHEFKDYFSAIAHYFPNFADLLNIWIESETKAGTKHLVNLIVDEQNTLFDRKKINGFNDQKNNVEKFVKWILSDEVLEKLQSKYFEFETEDFAEKISWAEQIITHERKSKASDTV